MGRLHKTPGFFRANRNKSATPAGHSHSADRQGTARTASVSAAVAVAVLTGLLGPVAPASAAPAATVTISSESGSTTVTPVLKLAYTAKNAAGKYGVVQAKLGGVWTDVQAPQKIGTASWTRKAEYTFQKEGAVDFRAALKAGSQLAVVSGTVKVTFKPKTPPAKSPAPAAGKTKPGSPPVPLKPVAKPASTPAARIDLSSSTPNVNSVKPFNFTGAGFEGSTIKLQRRTSSGAWATVWASKKQGASATTAQHNYRFGTESTGTFRAVLAKAGKTVAASPERVLSYARQGTAQPRTLSNVAFGDGLFASAQGIVAAGAQASHIYWLPSVYGDRKAHLQEFRGGRWVNTQTVYFKQSAGFQVTVKTTLRSGVVNRRYRFIVPATDHEKSWTSRTVTISHMNAAHSSPYKKAAYNYMKGYCPNPAIKLVSGLWSYANFPSYRISLSTQLGTGAGMRYVALHECAHTISYKLYADNIDALSTRMNVIYGTSGSYGREQLADCMSYAMGAAWYMGHYTTNCSGYRGTAAQAVLAGRRP